MRGKANTENAQTVEYGDGKVAVFTWALEENHAGWVRTNATDGTELWMNEFPTAAESPGGVKKREKPLNRKFCMR